MVGGQRGVDPEGARVTPGPFHIHGCCEAVSWATAALLPASTCSLQAEYSVLLALWVPGWNLELVCTQESGGMLQYLAYYSPSTFWVR